MVELNSKLGYFYDMTIQSWGHYYADYLDIALYQSDPVKNKVLWHLYYNHYYRAATL